MTFGKGKKRVVRNIYIPLQCPHSLNQGNGPHTWGTAAPLVRAELVHKHLGQISKTEKENQVKKKKCPDPLTITIQAFKRRCLEIG